MIQPPLPISRLVPSILPVSLVAAVAPAGTPEIAQMYIHLERVEIPMGLLMAAAVK